MSLPPILLGVVMLLLAVIVALLQRNKAQQAAHFAAINATIAEAATAQVEHRQRLDTELTTLHEAQRHETIIAENNLAARADFADDWGGLPTDDAAGAVAISGAAVTGTPGAASHPGYRANLFE